MQRAAPSFNQNVFSTTVPARLERLKWARFHTLVVVALGVTWILDGLEVTLAGSIAGALKESPALAFSDSDVGFAGSAYLSGAVIGALFFGWLTDRLGRKKLFFITLAVYLVATAATGLSWNGATFFLFRFFTGAGIGGEYAAINSTIQELVPARYRGATDLAINGSFWIGAAIGALTAVALLNPAFVNPELGWRLAFLIGAAIGLVIIFMRMWLPESPRWLIIHGRPEEAERIIFEIEGRVSASGGSLEPLDEKRSLRIRGRTHTPLTEVFDTLIVKQLRRTLVGLALMASQAFLYNAIFFTYALVLTKFFDVESKSVGWYILPFALTNFLGPLLLGPLFDSHGRRRMIALTYALSGVLLVASGVLFSLNLLTAVTMTLAWMVVFFFASPAASSAYLTVSETFPVEIRALAIAVFYAIGTGIGGVVAPFLFGALVQSGSRASVFEGYIFASALMIGAAIIAALFAVQAERRPLEEVATPLSAAE
ncbi:MAG TPA: MFS transporter [Roseiarcus sp.]|nr:MFS transporter [Roseiarcus sp.]